MDISNKKIVVTGGSGFLGSRIVKNLRDKGITDIIIPRSDDCDLRIERNCEMITKNVDIVVHAAGNSGGIGYNKDNPGSIFYDNIMMDTLLMEASRKNNVEKFIAIGTVCSYPKFTQVPFSEEQIWNGYPEETNAPYGLSKKMLIVQSKAYHEQYKFRSSVLVMTNLYGPGDNFDPNSSLVIPALIKKMYDAKRLGLSEVELWGDGSPSRDFLFVDDAARATILAAERYEKSEPINIGSCKEITIRELAELIKKIMKIEKLVIKWNSQKPGGQPRRCLNIERAKNEIGFVPSISIEDGLRQTVEWYNTQHKS